MNENNSSRFFWSPGMFSLSVWEEFSHAWNDSFMFQLGPSCMRRVLSGLAWALVSELGPFSSEVGPPGMKLALSDLTRICPAKPDKSLKKMPVNLDLFLKIVGQIRGVFSFW